MNKVFIGGSRHITRLNADIVKQLDNIISKGFSVLIGDAPGADKAVQSYLSENGYDQVEVFCTNGACRNNVGHWTIHCVPFASKQRNAQFYSAKDITMAEEANLGFMIWDGKSAGTLLNVYRLTRRHKKTVLYTAPTARLSVLNTIHDWTNLVADCSPVLRDKVRERIDSEEQRQPGVCKIKCASA
jgi:adenine-specific DNA-methyltransferase